MLFRPKFSKAQFKYFSSAAKTISEGIILGSSAAFFLPETLQLKESILFSRFLAFLLVGFIFLLAGAIMVNRSET